MNSKAIHQDASISSSYDSSSKTIQFDSFPRNISHLPQTAQSCLHKVIQLHKSLYEENYGLIPHRTQYEIQNRAQQLIERFSEEDKTATILDSIQHELETATQTPRQRRFFLHAIMLHANSTKLAKTVFDVMDMFQLNTTIEEVYNMLFRTCFIDPSVSDTMDFLASLPVELKDSHAYHFLFSSPLLDPQGKTYLSKITEMMDTAPKDLKPSSLVIDIIEAMEEVIVAPTQSILYQHEIDHMLTEYTFCLTWRANRYHLNPSLLEFFDRLPSKAFQGHSQNRNIVFKAMSNLNAFDRAYEFALCYFTLNDTEENPSKKPRFDIQEFCVRPFWRLALGKDDPNLFDQIAQYVKENPETYLMSLKSINYFFGYSSLDSEIILDGFLRLADQVKDPNHAAIQIYNAYIQSLISRESKDLIPVVEDVMRQQKAYLNRQTIISLLEALPNYSDGCSMFDRFRYTQKLSHDLFSEGPRTAFSFRYLMMFAEKYYWKESMVPWVINMVVKRVSRVPVSFYRMAMQMMLDVKDPDLLSWGTSTKVVDISSADRAMIKYEYFLQAALMPEFRWNQRNISRWFQEDVTQPLPSHLRYWIPIRNRFRTQPPEIHAKELTGDICYALFILSALNSSFSVPTEVFDYMKENVSDPTLWNDLITDRLNTHHANKQRLATLFNNKFGVNQSNFLSNNRKDHLIMFMYEATTWRNQYGKGEETEDLPEEREDSREKLGIEIYEALSSDKWHLLDHHVFRTAFLVFGDIPSVRKLLAKLAEDRGVDLELTLPRNELKISIKDC